MMVNSGKACLAAESFLGLDMTIPTEPIGSIPRPQKVITAFEQYERESLSREEFDSICSEAVRETIEKFEATGSPVITDGEQTKPSFATYPIHGLSNLNPGGVKIQFEDGHVRQLLSTSIDLGVRAPALGATGKLLVRAQLMKVNVSPACWAKVLYCRFCIVSIGVAGVSLWE